MSDDVEVQFLYMVFFSAIIAFIILYTTNDSKEYDNWSLDAERVSCPKCVCDYGLAFNLSQNQ